MSIYEYKCPFCNFKMELKQAMMEEHKASCPRCGQECQRVYSAVPFRMSDKKRKKELTGWRRSVF